MDLLPYVSGDAYCGLCMKTAADAALVANTHADFFDTVQAGPAPARLCLWCAGRLRGFAALRSDAHRAHYLLATLNNFGVHSLGLLDNREWIESEIGRLKTNRMVSEVVAVAHWVSPEPEYVEVKVESGSEPRKRRRKRRLAEGEGKREKREGMVVKVDPDVEDDDSWDTVPLKRLKDEEGRMSPASLVGNAASDASCIDAEETNLIDSGQPPAKNNKELARKTKTRKPTNKSKRKKLESAEETTEVKDPKTPDIHTAIDDLDNESYIVSEEVHQHVETLPLREAGDKQRAFRVKRASYVRAAHRCEPCALGYATREEYDAHMRNHSPSAGPHRCHPCDMYFEKHRELERHVQSHYRRHRCRVCSHASPDYRAAVKHYISQHSRVKFTCMHCNKEFRRPINLKKHIQKLHKKEQETGCAVCGDAFPDATQLQAHMQSHKPEEIAWHECPICKKKSRNKYNMTQHISAHEKESLPIMCDICHKTFKTNLLLTTHIQRLHTPNSKKFQCDECGKFFYDKGELRIHVQWTHKREGGVDCPQCARKFRTAYLLNDHVRRVHENIPKPKDKLCDFCGRGFSSRKSLKSHRYIHTGERPHACPDCGQTFRQRCAMRLHHKSKHLRMRWRDLVAKKKG